MEADVIVVGAGLSGLAAADFLKNRDPSLNVIVLEANDRVGGRLLSQKIGDCSFDLGGQWILPEHKNLLQIVDKLGLRTVFPSEESNEKLKKVIQVGRKGRLRTTNPSPDPMVLPKKLGRHTGIRAWFASLELTYIVWKLDNLYAYITDPTDPYNSRNFPESLAKHLDSITVEAYLTEKTRFKSVKDVIEIQIRLLMGADLNRISVLFLLSYAKWQNATSFYGFLHNDCSEENSQKLPPLCVQNGAQQICEQMVKQTIGEKNLILNQPVSHISYADKMVNVITKGGQIYQTSQVIVAIPPNIQREIEFSPKLDASKKYLVSSMTMGSTIKFVLTYREAFWRYSNFSGDFISHGSPITWMCDVTYQNKTPTLVGFLAGHQAVAYSQMPQDDLKTAILDQLSIIWGEWALEPTGFLLENWLTDSDFIEGGPLCYPGIGTMIDWPSIRASHGPIHFAGTESAVKFAGSMAGAVHAGHRAAIEVLDNLRPQSLSSQDYFFLKEAQGQYLKEQKGAKSNGDYSIYRWTVVLPSIAFAVAWTALKLRSTWGHLVVPKW